MVIVHELLRVLIGIDLACAAILWVMGMRLAFLRAGVAPAWRGLSTLRRPLASELSNEFRDYNRQLIRLMLAFALVVAVGFLLFWLDSLFAGGSSN